MAAITLPDPPPSDGVIALPTRAPADAPVPVEACQEPEIPRWTQVPSPYIRAHADAFVTFAQRRLAFDELGLEHLDLRTHTGNLVSQAVALRAGFVPAWPPVTRRPECDGPGMVTVARRRD